jgi:hypothetical protein
MKLALIALERENKGLKELVVRLSETVLRNIFEANLEANLVDFRKIPPITESQY